jgi:hypothetical protein
MRPLTHGQRCLLHMLARNRGLPVGNCDKRYLHGLLSRGLAEVKTWEQGRIVGKVAPWARLTQAGREEVRRVR